MRFNHTNIRGYMAYAPQDDSGAPAPDDSNDDGNQQPNGEGNDDGAKDQQKAATRTSRMGGLMQHRQAADGDDPGANDQADDKGDKKPTSKPKGIPDKFWDDKTGQAKVDDLAKSYTELEKQLGELRRQKAGGDLPKSVEEYFDGEIEVPETASNFSGLTAEDPGVQAWAKVCHEHGIGKGLASKLMAGMLEHMNDHVQPPVDFDAEIASLGRGGPQLIDGLAVWVEGQEASGSMSDDDLDVVEDLLKTAKGVRFLAKMRAATGEKPIPVDLSGAGISTMSQEQWAEEMKDAVKRKDYKRQAELEKMGEGINRDRHY